MNKNIKLIISLSIPILVGSIAGFFTSGAIKGWYALVNKPSFNPPNWIFAPMWSLLYILMGYACFLIWKSIVENKIKSKALTIYAIQLFLNFMWSFLFFYFQNPALALIDIVLMIITISITIKYFYPISKLAAYLLVPYLLWVMFATALNFEIWRLN